MDRVQSVADRVRSVVVRSLNQTLENLEIPNVFPESNVTASSSALTITLQDVPLKPLRQLVSPGEFGLGRVAFGDPAWREVFGHGAGTDPAGQEEAGRYPALGYRSAVLLRWRSRLQNYCHSDCDLAQQSDYADCADRITAQIIERVTSVKPHPIAHHAVIEPAVIEPDDSATSKLATRLYTDTHCTDVKIQRAFQTTQKTGTQKTGYDTGLLDLIVSDRLLVTWFNDWRLMPSLELALPLTDLPFPIYHTDARCRSLLTAAVTDGLRPEQPSEVLPCLPSRPPACPNDHLPSYLPMITSLSRLTAIERSLFYQLVTLTDQFSELVLSKSQKTGDTYPDLLKLIWQLTHLFEQWHSHSRPWEALRQGDRETASDRLALVELMQAILQTFLQDLVT